jgi:outer membrane protein
MSYFTKLMRQAATLLFVTACSTSAWAQSAGDNVINLGWFYIAPQDSSTPLTLTSPLSGVIADTGATVHTASTWGVSFSHFLTDNWAVALDIGMPPTYKLYGTGILAPSGQIGQAKQLAPTVLGKYFFFDANAQFRPFVGLGVSRVSYKDVELTSSFQDAMALMLAQVSQNQIIAANTTADLDNSWAPVVNVGASYAITKQWYANFSVSYIKLKTTANLTTATNIGPVYSTTSLTIDPIVTYASVSYRF